MSVDQLAEMCENLSNDFNVRVNVSEQMSSDEVVRRDKGLQI